MIYPTHLHIVADTDYHRRYSGSGKEDVVQIIEVVRLSNQIFLKFSKKNPAFGIFSFIIASVYGTLRIGRIRKRDQKNYNNASN